MNMASAAAISSSDYRASVASSCAGGGGGGGAPVNRQSSQTSSNGAGSSPNRTNHYRGYSAVPTLGGQRDDARHNHRHHDDADSRLRGDDATDDDDDDEDSDYVTRGGELRLSPLANRGDRLSLAVDRLQASVKGFCDSHRVATPATSNLKRRGHAGGGTATTPREKKTPTFRVPSDKRKQVLVFVRVVFVKIGEIDTLKETFMADVFIQLKWREPTLDGKRHAASEPIDWSHYWQPRLYVENTVGEPSESVWHQLVFTGDGQAIVYERRRVKGCFLENLELDQFPFDTQELTLTLTSELWEREVVLEEDESELSSINVESFVDEQEWYLHKHTDMSKRLRASQYQDSDCKHPSISASCRASRRAGFYIWNIFLVMMFICSLAFATFSVDCQLPQNRLQLSFLLLLTTITFKFVVSQTLPRISYLTYLDKYILISMAILCSVCVWHSIVPLFGEGLDVKLDKVALFGLGGFYVLFHVVFVLRIYSLYIKKHWKYSEKDRVHGERLYSTHTGGSGTEDSA